MFCTLRHFGAGTVFVMMVSSLLLTGCNHASSAGADSSSGANSVITPGPSPTGFAPPGPSPVPVGGPTLAQSSPVALAIINAMPAQIGRFTLSQDPKLTYVATVQNIVVGDRITYTTSSGAQLVFAIWIGQDANYPVDRYNVELSRLAVPSIPVEIGDQAFVAPTNKGRDDNLAFNPAVWGIARFRNILIDLDPTKTLTDQTSISQDEAVQLLQAALNAIPK
ncbi:MAG: hypothetical protein ACYDBJ_28945 [Aggregatilineales bacterium]